MDRKVEPHLGEICDFKELVALLHILTFAP